jgi:hypothetical protein
VALPHSVLAAEVEGERPLACKSRHVGVS